MENRWTEPSNGKELYTLTATATSVSTTISVEDNIITYPNPATNSFFIKTNFKSQIKLDVYDITGKLIISKQLMNADINEINTTDINSGLYLLRISDFDGNIKTKKLLIEK